MSFLDLVFMAMVLGWLLGVGLLAHAVPHWVLHDPDLPDFVRVGLQFAPELFAVPMAIVIVGWPLTIPGLILIYRRKGKG